MLCDDVRERRGREERERGEGEERERRGEGEERRGEGEDLHFVHVPNESVPHCESLSL